MKTFNFLPLLIIIAFNYSNSSKLHEQYYFCAEHALALSPRPLSSYHGSEKNEPIFRHLHLGNNCECHLRVNNRSAHTTFVSASLLRDYLMIQQHLCVCHISEFDAFCTRGDASLSLGETRSTLSHYIIINLLT